MKWVRFVMGLASCSLALLAGCGGGERLEGTVNAGGTVTLDGKAVDGATVSFVPDGEGRSASAMTSSDGTFRLTTVNPGDGAIPGRYRISVTKLSQATGDGRASSQEEGMNQIRERMKNGGEAAMRKPAEKPKDELPARYKDPATSGLVETIQASGDNTHKLELTSK
jgi:hypothetical protein